MPDSYTESGHLITRTALKNTMDATSDKYERNELFKSNETLIVMLQSLVRGYLNRKHLKDRRAHLAANLDKIIKIQAWWRMVMQRSAYINRLVHFESNEKAVVLIQSYVRMWLNRKRYVERREYFYENEDAIVKIQSYLRAKRARSDYISLGRCNLLQLNSKCIDFATVTNRNVLRYGAGALECGCGTVRL